MPGSVVPAHYRTDLVLRDAEIAIRVKLRGRDEQFGSVVILG